MMIKEILDKIATKYNVAITYQENSAEITGFSGEDNFKLKFQKVEIRMEIERELDKLGMDYKVISSFNPDKLTVEVKE
jgi:hypothetical protein